MTVWGEITPNVGHSVDGIEEDLVVSLPSYGPPKTKQFAGLSAATSCGTNRLFYWFVEADVGSSSDETPLLIWLNGGPGASSLMGLLTENLGPQKISHDSKLVDNVNHITKKYHVMAVDNPVGSGFSITSTGAYVKNEEEMRAQFVYALRGFYKKHPQYARNPLWITGESYAGKYVPNIAYEIATTAPEMPLRGVMIGNGLYNQGLQVTTIGTFAFGAGIIDENVLKEEQAREEQCAAAIRSGKPRAGQFCENVTVRWLYEGPQAVAGELFYYDFGMDDADELNVITTSLGSYLDRADVKRALHVGSSATWQNKDETGPVAQALANDFALPSTYFVEKLLGSFYRVVMYNGVRDGSVCNHIGNLKALQSLVWPGAADFAAAQNRPWPSTSSVMGHVRVARNLTFATIMRTGHLVPTVVPESFSTLLGMIFDTTEEAHSTLVV